jgi:hypothetical protein
VFFDFAEKLTILTATPIHTANLLIVKMDILPFTFFAASVSLGIVAVSHRKVSASQPTSSQSASLSAAGGKRRGVSPEIKAEMLSRISSFFGEDKFEGIQVGTVGAKVLSAR